MSQSYQSGNDGVKALSVKCLHIYYHCTQQKSKEQHLAKKLSSSLFSAFALNGLGGGK